MGKFIDDNGNEIVLKEGESLFVKPDGTVKIIPNGMYGVLLDEPVKDVKDFIKYVCKYYGYQRVPNPDYDPSKDISEENPLDLPNPDITEVVFAKNWLRQKAADVVNEGRTNDDVEKALKNIVPSPKVIINN